MHTQINSWSDKTSRKTNPLQDLWPKWLIYSFALKIKENFGVHTFEASFESEDAPLSCLLTLIHFVQFFLLDF